MTVGVVAALPAEGRALGRPTGRSDTLAILDDGMLLAVSGVGDAAAAAAAERLIEAGARALVSWGVAGGLEPSLATGTVCLPVEVLGAGNARFATAAAWRLPLKAALRGRATVVEGALLCAAAALDSAAAKLAAHRQTGALAVDMESAAVGRIAHGAKMPFIAVRVIVDTAADAIPRSILRASRAGRVRIVPLLTGLIGAPADIVPLLKLSLRYRTAIGRLRHIARSSSLAPPPLHLGLA